VEKFSQFPFKIEYKNRLPHIAPLAGVFFVTFRLKGSLPYKFNKMFNSYTQGSESKDLTTPTNTRIISCLDNVHFIHFDDMLDRGHLGEKWLSNKRIAEYVSKKLFEFDGTWYDLYAMCIMPNHVHILFDTSVQLLDENGFYQEDKINDYVQLDRIMKRIKGGSSRKINSYLRREGNFWQKDSYDHYVRSEGEFCRIYNYILMNPVKAGLVQNWEDWNFTFWKEV